MRVTIQGRTLALDQGDITDQQVDAIINAANSALAGGGGVDGAIHRRAGPQLMAETRRRYPEGCATGSAVITDGYNLPAKFVIHAVGPIWAGGTSGERELLSSAYRRSLELAGEHHCTSIALPALSTGAFGYPMDEASRVALRTVLEVLKQPTTLEIVRFVLFSAGAYGVFSAALEELLASSSSEPT